MSILGLLIGGLFVGSVMQDNENIKKELEDLKKLKGVKNEK